MSIFSFLFNTHAARSNPGESLYKKAAKKVFEIGLNYTISKKYYYLYFGLLEEDNIKILPKRKELQWKITKDLSVIKIFLC